MLVRLKSMLAMPLSPGIFLIYGKCIKVLDKLFGLDSLRVYIPCIGLLPAYGAAVMENTNFVPT